MIKRIFIFAAALFFLFASTINTADAYVRVHGYYRKDGTYVRPYVRSNPNGLKYDNYSWKPGQGLYNDSYGTRGSYWDTPTYITDPNYYTGKSLYNSQSSTPSPDYSLPKYPTSNYNYNPNQTTENAVLNNVNTTKTNNIPVCLTGYKKNGFGTCEKITVPANATMDYSTNNWVCNYGYIKNYNNSCDKLN